MSENGDNPQALTVEQVRSELDVIRDCDYDGGDYEVAHSLEDGLLHAFVESVANRHYPSAESAARVAAEIAAWLASDQRGKRWYA